MKNKKVIKKIHKLLQKRSNLSDMSFTNTSKKLDDNTYQITVDGKDRDDIVTFRNNLYGKLANHIDMLSYSNGSLKLTCGPDFLKAELYYNNASKPTLVAELKSDGVDVEWPSERSAA